MVSNEGGRLFVVATPIGNLDDLSERARVCLAEADAVAAEDTRRARRLLAHIGVSVPLISLHEHNEQARVDGLLSRLRAGESIALVSDAGTPLISDPGYRLVRAARQAGLPVVPVPGASSVIAALSVAGLPTDRFAFEGFLPARRAARRQRLASLAADPRTLVFFESGRRVAGCLTDMADAFGGEREAVIARELTKLHETVRMDALAILAEWVTADREQQLGEFVVMVRGSDAEPASAASVSEDAVLAPLVAELPTRQAARIAARITGRPRNALYRRALELAGTGKA